MLNSSGGGQFGSLTPLSSHGGSMCEYTRSGIGGLVVRDDLFIYGNTSLSTISHITTHIGHGSNIMNTFYTLCANHKTVNTSKEQLKTM